MKNKRILIAVTCLFVESSFAHVITYSAGPAWYMLPSKQVLNLDAETINAYVFNSSSRPLFNNELFFGIQKLLSSKFKGQIGLAINQTSNARIGGEVWQENDPDFANFNYKYYVAHAALTLKGKLLLTHFRNNLQPYLAASAGVASNRAFAFNQIPKISEAVVAYNFSQHTINTFTYTAEAGVQKQITPNWVLGIGYEFADLGKSKLGQANEGIGVVAPYLNHLFINQLQVNISYLWE